MPRNSDTVAWKHRSATVAADDHDLALFVRMWIFGPKCKYSNLALYCKYSNLALCEDRPRAPETMVRHRNDDDDDDDEDGEQISAVVVFMVLSVGNSRNMRHLLK
jgi:hypothetical protein